MWRGCSCVCVCVWVLCIQRNPIWKFDSELDSNSVSIRLHLVRSSCVHWLFNRWHVDTIASMQAWYTDVYVCVCVSVSIHMHIRRALLIPRASFDKRAAKSRNLQNLCVHTCVYSVCVCVCSVCVFLVVINALRDSCDLWDCWGLCVSQRFVRQMDTFRLIAAKWFK